jgi:hypothetical protein
MVPCVPPSIEESVTMASGPRETLLAIELPHLLKNKSPPSAELQSDEMAAMKLAAIVVEELSPLQRCDPVIRYRRIQPQSD